MTPDDDMISAWLDGTLDAEGEKRMTELAARDEAFAGRVTRLRHLDDLVRAAVPAEPEPPAELLARLGLAPTPRLPEAVVDLAAVRRDRAAQAAVPRAPRVGGEWLRLAAQLVLVAGIGITIFAVSRPEYHGAAPDDNYRMLGSAPDAAAREANALVRFAPGIAAEEAGRIAASSGLRLLGKPNAAGAWKAAVAPGRRDAALDMLRRNALVVMAEPIDGGPQ